MDSAGRRAYSRWTVRFPAVATLLAGVLVAWQASADTTSGSPSGWAVRGASGAGGGFTSSATEVTAVAGSGSASQGAAVPPAPSAPRHEHGFVQFGAALTVEILASAGAACSDAPPPCVIGSGGGLRISGGYRTSGPLYLGAAYEFSKQDSNNLLRLPILQQLRIEARYLLNTREIDNPYLLLGGGLAGYGSDWGLETFGPLVEAGLGIEIQLSRTSIFGASAAYRLLSFHNFEDPAGEMRPGGIMSFVGIELMLEQRDPVGD